MYSLSRLASLVAMKKMFKAPIIFLWSEGSNITNRSQCRINPQLKFYVQLQAGLTHPLQKSLSIHITTVSQLFLFLGCILIVVVKIIQQSAHPSLVVDFSHRSGGGEGVLGI